MYVRNTYMTWNDLTLSMVITLNWPSSTTRYVLFVTCTRPSCITWVLLHFTTKLQFANKRTTAASSQPACPPATAESWELTCRQSLPCGASPPGVLTPAYPCPPGSWRMAPGAHKELDPLEMSFRRGSDPHRGRGRWLPAPLSFPPGCGGWQRAEGPPQSFGQLCRGPAGHRLSWPALLLQSPKLFRGDSSALEKPSCSHH